MAAPEAAAPIGPQLSLEIDAQIRDVALSCLLWFFKNVCREVRIDMVAFLVWGNKPNSFAVANGSLLDFQNMPEDYEGKLKMYEWNAMRIEAFSTGPNGYHWVANLDRSWAARGPSNMLPYLSTQLVIHGPNGLLEPGRGRATFATFAPDGICWFIRYDSRQCLWGPGVEHFPSTWRDLIKELEQTHPRKDECIDFVAFGLHDLLLVRYENGNSAMLTPDDPAVKARISKGLIKEVEERFAAGWTLGNRTRLCTFDTERWFVEWKRGSAAEFRFSMGLDHTDELPRVQAVLNGVGNDAAAVANSETAQLIAASSGWNQAVAVSNFLTR